MNHGSSSSSDCGLHCFQRRHNGQTGPEGLAALPLWTHTPIKGHEINFWGTAVSNTHMYILRGEINSCSFHLFFTYSTGCSYLRLELHHYAHLPSLLLPPSHKHAHIHTQAHTSQGNVSVYSFGRGQLHTWWQPRMVVLAQVRVCGERRAKEGRVGWMGPQACPSGPAQPAHSSSFSTGASAGMSPHVRDHCLKGGLLVWLKRSFRRINRWKGKVLHSVLQSDVLLYRMHTGTY